METITITLETTVAYPGKWRLKDEERLITFTIPTHSELLPHLGNKPPKSISCYYRNLKFKYGTLTRGTPIRLTAEIEYGKRGGAALHIKQLEVIGPVAQSLTTVSSKMLDKWAKQFDKENGTDTRKTPRRTGAKQGTLSLF
ncbi:hypothetical protein [Dyadobacter sp. CY343]|uniref:hypothetical protein n=1 Tax=Dyadobacter sp. CY343 TaxID=2907299 RepID=UPI001F2C27AA|nr:hypothetical protein [Dyadobacter sp. CY343]MCE7061232.1 hypothetical protein [Dyadobacter sp. CY343]